MATTAKTISASKSMALSEQRSYSEVVDFLDKHWVKSFTDPQLTIMKALDKALGEPSKKIRSVVISGTNGKSLTTNFCVKLFIHEGINVGSFYGPHSLNYNERFAYNGETISNKMFTEIGNEVLNAARTAAINASSFELLTMMAIVYFAQQNADVVLLESFQNGACDPTLICTPTVFVVTRLTSEEFDPKAEGSAQKVSQFLEGVKAGTIVVSGDQSKLNLQIMEQATKERGGIWEMPIRKLAILQYPFEQLHGRCAALAERICKIFVEKASETTQLLLKSKLLAPQEGKRGRPSLEAKRLADQNQQKTLAQFWKEETSSLPGKFHLLDRENPSILLDNAYNVDGIENLLLGIRLLNYQRRQRPLKGLALIFACDKNTMNIEQFLRLLRYFTKRNSAHVILCPIKTLVPGTFEESWNIDQVMQQVQSMKIKADAANSFGEAFELAKKTVDERHGMIVISGSQSIVADYWKYKGLKNITNCR